MVVLQFLKASQVTFIYKMCYTIQTVSKQLHSNEQENNRINIAKFIMKLSLLMWA